MVHACTIYINTISGLYPGFKNLDKLIRFIDDC